MGEEGKAMRAASLMFLDAENSSGEEGAAREAAVKHVWKWEERLQKEVREGE